jgi:hypothetical protein
MAGIGVSAIRRTAPSTTVCNSRSYFTSRSFGQTLLGISPVTTCRDIGLAQVCLHESGYIDDPVSKAKSVVMTDEGAERSKQLFEKYFMKG